MSDGLDALRAELDGIDAEIAILVGKRAGVARRIGMVKRGGHLPALDASRESVVSDRFVGKATAAGYPPHEAWKLIREIVRVCRGIVESETSRP